MTAIMIAIMPYANLTTVLQTDAAEVRISLAARI